MKKIRTEIMIEVEEIIRTIVPLQCAVCGSEVLTRPRPEVKEAIQQIGPGSVELGEGNHQAEPTQEG